MTIRRREGETMETGVASATAAAKKAALRLVDLVAEEGDDGDDFNSWLIRTEEYDALVSALARLNDLSVPE